MIHETAQIHPSAVVEEGAIIGANVKIGPFCFVDSKVEIGEGTELTSHVVVKGPTLIGKENKIYQFASIGEECQDLKYAGEDTRLEIGDRNMIRESVTMHRGTVQDGGLTKVGSDNLFMINAHVAHDCMIGDRCIFANNATLAGHVKVGNHAIIGGMSAIHQFCEIGEHCMLGGGSIVVKDVPPYVMAQGNHCAPFGINIEGLKRRGFEKPALHAIRRAYKEIYRLGKTLDEAKQAIADIAKDHPEVQAYVDFFARSKRGIIRYMTKPLRIGIVAGEISGDILGAGFIQAIKQQYPDAEFVGIGGPRMIAQGCDSLFDMEELAVMGLVEVLGRLPRLLKVKAELVRYFKSNPPDVFVGIDAPDFNLRLEADLKQSGIKTVHYVSPSVWAWRQKRIFKIEAATHLVLAFLPFEKAFYDKFNVPCQFIGHTMADSIPLQPDQRQAQDKLGLDPTKTWLAVLPGSRGSEVGMLAEPFIQACQKLKKQHPDLGFVVALVNQKRREQFEQVWQATAPELDFVLVDDTARDVMTASDVVLLASGTVALECMLVKRPMVVGYRVKPITYWIAKRMIKTEYVSLPNILADRALVPELLQHDCTPEALANAVNHYLTTDNQELIEQFTQMHEWIKKEADKQAASAVLELIGKA